MAIPLIERQMATLDIGKHSLCYRANFKCNSKHGDIRCTLQVCRAINTCVNQANKALMQGTVLHFTLQYRFIVSLLV